MVFRPADQIEQLRAIGSLEGLVPELRRALTAADDFDPIPPPGAHDWLSVSKEKGQTFDRFTHTSSNRPAGTREHLYLRPVGSWSGHSELLQRLQRFASVFFMRDVRVLPTLEVEGSGITTRHNRFTDVTQLKTRDILPLLASSLPPDAWCVLGLTLYDLYPHDTWSFVFGEALLDDRVGIFSVARYDPAFYGKRADDPSLLLRRSCKVLAHEACHMFGIRHCVYFNCLMNGSNHLEESDRRPPHLCPVDLRKLHWTLGFDIAGRYRRLHDFWREAGVADEVHWIERRLAFIEGTLGA
jgi:archaemetzincin